MRVLVVLSLVVLLSSCSTLFQKRNKNQSSNESKVENMEQEILDALSEATQKLDLLVKQAEEGGEGSKKFLASDLYLKATDASLRGDSHTAVFLYQYVIKLFPDDLYARKKYAVELIRTGKMEEAEKYELEETILELEGYRGRHTELVSVYIPAGCNVHQVTTQIEDEKGTATNIKSKTTRKNVIEALEKIARHL
ncbi:MAG: hypothetical protein HOJ35_01265, partial [Bdellovibrionales bacterium]|nr:hypothetical protein [Bdellovibrionales bacterium]